SPFHTILGADAGLGFFLRAGPLGDILPIPLPVIQNVASIGDVFLTAGLAFFLFATIVRRQDDEFEPERGYGERPLSGFAGATRLPRGIDEALGQHRIRPGTGLASSLADTASLDRPILLGGTGTGLAGPSSRSLLGRVLGADGQIVDVWRSGSGGRSVALAPVPSAGSVGFDDGAIALPGRPRIEVGARVRRHPYVRLALNGPFTALWTGQMISLFGDRVHQMALAALVVGITDSVLAGALVFVAATLPNLFLAPFAGAFVDRWNQRDVMVVSDLLRASVVLIIPIAAITNVWLVYPLIFLVTTISIFFRPARVAVLPRIVSDDDLLTANSALWAGETFADIVGYPLAGLFVAFLGTALPLAFWIDAATYGASAILIASIAVPAVRRAAPAQTLAAARRSAGSAGSSPAPEGEADAEPELEPIPTPTGILAEMREGFTFLRNDPVLFANTIQATFAQIAIGTLTALTYVFVQQTLGPRNGVSPTTGYAFLEASIGIGNLIGGFVIGL
ncbi:MAG: MFS transporter, partial [Candidatus Limnocylindrales bacterium]